MEFGIFDHLDRGALPLPEYYEARLKLIEAYDRAGFVSYHVAEHHATPLGMAPSPSVFLAAVAQRTKRLRFGPMVYALPLYHPLRLIEEICMLDQMSAGRLDIGFGRGASPIEIAYYGPDPTDAEAMYREALDIILQGLSTGKVTYRGKFFAFDDFPTELEPFQKPHPPLWYGVHSTQSAERAARAAMNLISLDTADETRPFADTYRSVWRETHGSAKKPGRIGLGRFVVVADTDAAALAIARRAYPVWHRSFSYLFVKHGYRPSHPRPPDFDTLNGQGKGVAGAPETVAAFLAEEMGRSGADYLVGQFAFGDLSPEETMRSVDLFVAEVMPALRAGAAAAAGRAAAHARG